MLIVSNVNKVYWIFLSFRWGLEILYLTLVVNKHSLHNILSVANDELFVEILSENRISWMFVKPLMSQSIIHRIIRNDEHHLPQRNCHQTFTVNTNCRQTMLPLYSSPQKPTNFSKTQIDLKQSNQLIEIFTFMKSTKLWITLSHLIMLCQWNEIKSILPLHYESNTRFNIIDTQLANVVRFSCFSFVTCVFIFIFYFIFCHPRCLCEQRTRENLIKICKYWKQQEGKWKHIEIVSNKLRSWYQKGNKKRRRKTKLMAVFGCLTWVMWT